MPIISTIKMTARQFEQLGEDPPGVRLELVDGAIAATPSPTPKHAFCHVRLLQAIADHVDRGQLGQLYTELNVPLDQYNVRRPDLLYIAVARLDIVTDRRLIGPPDLCVEVVSPSSEQIDRRDKFDQYASASVPYYWIADPDARTLEGFALVDGIYRPSGSAKDNQKLTLPPFNDLVIDLSRLWRPT